MKRLLSIIFICGYFMACTNAGEGSDQTVDSTAEKLRDSLYQDSVRLDSLQSDTATLTR